jgi:hypothetical protein
MKSPYLQNLEVHHSVQADPPRVPILSQKNLFYAIVRIPWRSISVLSSHLRLGLPSNIFTFTCLDQNCVYIYHNSFRPEFSTHLNIHNLITLIASDKNRLWSSSLYNFRYPVASSLLGANILSEYYFRTLLIYYSSLNVRDKISQGKIMAFKQTFYLCFRLEV